MDGRVIATIHLFIIFRLPVYGSLLHFFMLPLQYLVELNDVYDRFAIT